MPDLVCVSGSLVTVIAIDKTKHTLRRPLSYGMVGGTAVAGSRRSTQPAVQFCPWYNALISPGNQSCRQPESCLMKVLVMNRTGVSSMRMRSAIHPLRRLNGFPIKLDGE